MDYLLRWLDQRKPDIVGLQKIRVPEEEFPYDKLRAAGYYAEAHCRRNDFGVGTLSREEPTLITRGLPGQEDFGARLLTVEVEGLSFSSVYAPYGKIEGLESKLAWLRSLATYVQAPHCRSEQRVLCGDFNVVQEDIDNSVGSPRPGTLNYSEAERREFSSLLKSGFVDLYAHRYPDGRDRFTYWPYTLNKFGLKFGVRLDLILGTEGIIDRLREINVDIDYRKVVDGLRPSECAPVIADLDD